MVEPYFTKDGKFRNPVQEQRYKEIEEIWKPRLNEIFLKTAEKVGGGVRLEEKDYGFQIVYDEEYPKWAQINTKKKIIYIGQKFFALNNLQKENILMHEFCHFLLKFKRHTREGSGGVCDLMRRSGINVFLDEMPDWEDRKNW
jgi:hypothetical protein